MVEKTEDSGKAGTEKRQGRGGRNQERSRRRGGRNAPQGGQRSAKVAIVSRADGDSHAWAERIAEHLQAHARAVSRLEVKGDAGLTEVLKQARSHGAHRIVAVGRARFVRWAAQAMVGSLMPLAPALVPGSKPLFGHAPLPQTGWEPQVQKLLQSKFIKVDMAMGNVKPFLHQLLAGFPTAGGKKNMGTWRILTGPGKLNLKVEVDRAQVEGEFWCMAIANADLTDYPIRWLPGSDWTDQSLDLLLVRPRSAWQRWQFVKALKIGEHGALPGVLRFRGHRIAIHSEKPWQYSADGGQVLDAADPLVIEARPEMLRLVAPATGG
jgi:diacylglycerol kinase family enzyme